MIIAVSGKKRSGKDSFYHLTKNFLKHRNVFRYAFADPVKDYATKYFGYNRDAGDKESSRFILQGIGQMFREEVRKSYWIDIIREEIEEDYKKFGSNNVLAIVTDVRYMNEVEWAVETSDILLRITRPTLISPDSHTSEVELDSYEFKEVIVNDGTEEDYSRKVELWLQEKELR